MPSPNFVQRIARLPQVLTLLSGYPDGLPLQQIADHPESSVNDIAARTFTHQSSVSVVIQRLVAANLVAKVPAAHDRRLTRLTLTAQGRRALARTPRSVQQDLVAAVSGLPPADRRTLARLMTTLARAVTPARTAPRPPMFFEGEDR